MKQLIEFVKKNSVVIIGVLVLLVVLQWCQYRSDVLYRNPDQQAIEQVTDKIQDAIGDNQLPIGSNKDNRPVSSPWLSYLLMVGLVVFVFIAQRRGWLEKLIPGMVIVRTKIIKSRTSGRRMLQIFFLNITKESHTFDGPVVEFMKLGDTKSFRINVNKNNYSFPITLTNNTSHKVVIDLDQFYEKIPDLKQYRLLRVKVMINGAKVKKTIPKFVW